MSKSNDAVAETAAVRIEQLSHRYSKDWAIKDISLACSSTGILGLLGANGAGKSTLMNIMCGVLYQTKGEVHIDGIDIREQPLEAKQQVGFLPQQAPLHMELTVDEYLSYCAGLRNVAKGDIRKAVDSVKQQCGLTHFSDRLISNLSGGYRQRVGIAQAIIHEPRIVVLDEPMNGLDPNQISEVRKLIKGIAKQRLVLLSSHILADIQAICSRIIMIDQGVIVFEGSITDFNEYTEPNILQLQFESPPAKDQLLAIDGITEVDFVNGKRIQLTFEGDQSIAERIIASSIANDWRLREIGFERSSLEATFARLSVERTGNPA